MAESDFFVVASKPRSGSLTRRLVAIVISIVLIVAAASWNWGHAEISGRYQGQMDNGRMGIKVSLQQVGDEVAGNATVSQVISYKYHIRQMSLVGEVHGNTINLRGTLKDGGHYFLTGKPFILGDQFEIVGKGHFEASGLSRGEVPLEIKKVKTFL